MKDFAATTGGHPISVDDLTWLEQMFLEVTQDMIGQLAAPGGGNRIICGGEITQAGPGRDVNGGWVLWNGELIKFNSLSVGGTGTVVLTKTWSNIAPSRIYANGNVVWVYREQMASVGTTTAPALSHFNLETALRFGVSAWTNATIQPDWQSFSPSPGLYHDPSHRLRSDGTVELRGHLEVATSGALQVAFVLPAGRRPKRLVSFSKSYITNTGTVVPCWVEVAANGEVIVQMPTGNVGWHLSLDGISFDTRA